MAQLVVSGILDWLPTDPDGSECVACGCQCFLDMYESVFVVSARELRTGLFVCWACKPPEVK